jgi:hypothetical protein
MSNLEKADRSSNSQVKCLLEMSPNEIKDHICSFFQDGDFSLECNYLMPQFMWAEVFFKIPFLWDLDTEAVYEKTGSSKDDLEKWNWEKLVRQAMNPAKPPPRDADFWSQENVWGYSKVGLNVPGGFTNRRRIWQMLEEMNPGVSSWKNEGDEE